MGFFSRKKMSGTMEVREQETEETSLAVLTERRRRFQAELSWLKKVLAFSFSLNIVLAVVFVLVCWWAFFIRQDVFFAATPDGRIQKLVPLTEPYVSSAGLMNWVTQAVTETYTLDFINYKKSLSRVHPYYSREAWSQLIEQIRPLVNSVTDKRLLLFAVADEAPRILAEGLYTKDLYAWKVEFPMTLTHQTAEAVQTFRWIVQVTVGRANVAEKPAGVEIIQFIIKPR